MVEYLIHSSIFMKAIAACCLLGIVSFLVLEISYISMIRSTSDISRSKKTWLAKMTKKYKKYHEMNIRINNVGAFVDRLFRKKKLLGLPVSFWVTLEHLSIAGCAISGAAGALVASQQGKELMDVMITYLTGVTAACILLFLDTFLRAGEKRQTVVNNIEDYLENVLDNKISVVAPPRSRKEPAEEKRAGVKKKAEPIKKSSPPVTPEEEKLLKDVFQEFFIV